METVSLESKEDLLKNQVVEVIGMDTILYNSFMNTQMRNIHLSFAKAERNMIGECTQEGKAIARQKLDFSEVDSQI